MEATISRLDVPFFDLGALPVPRTDAKVIAVAARLAAAEAAARGVAAELASAREAESLASAAYGEALGRTATTSSRAAAALDDAVAGVARIRSRLLVAGRVVEALREKHAEALETAKHVILGAEWTETRETIEAAAIALGDAHQRVLGQLANLDRLRTAVIAARNRNAVTVVTFKRAWIGTDKAGYQAGDVAGLDAAEAAEIISKGAATANDAWTTEAVLAAAPATARV